MDTRSGLLGPGWRFAYESSLTQKSGGNVSVIYNDGRTLVFEKNGSTYIKNEYDSMGRVVRQTDEEGRTYRMLYDDYAQENTFIVLDTGSVTRYQYDENLYITRINYADGSYERFEYDERGNRTAVRARSGYATQYAYDEGGNLTSVTNALGDVSTLSYDADGNITGLVSPEGGELRFAYDDKGNLLKTAVLTSGGIWTENTYTYDEKGRILTVTDAEGGVTSFTYGSSGQPEHVVNALGGTVTYTYDGLGRRTGIQDGMGTTVLVYNEKDQLVTITSPDGGVTEFFYDAVGNVTKVVLPEQREEALEAGISTAEAKGYTYTYDALDRMIASCSPEGVVSSCLYDVTGEVTQQNMPEYADAVLEDEENYRYTYDSAGNLTTVTAPDGGITSYTYDAGGNILTITYPDGQETGACVRFEYDALDRIVSMTDTLGQVQCRYSYDKDGNATAVTDAEGYTTWYSYSPDGLVTEARVPKKEENGQVWYQIFCYIYDRNGNLLTGETSSEFVTETGVPENWDRVTCTYDAAGNMTSVTDSTGGEIRYVYDEYSRLLEQNVVNGVTDPVAAYYTYDCMGQMVETEGYTYSYDLNGNLTSIRSPEGAVSRYVYDADNRLIRTEEDVQVDTLTMQDNAVSVRPLDRDWEQPDGTGFLYPENSFLCEVVTDLESSARSADILILYEENLLELEDCTTTAYGVTADTSTPGMVRLTMSRSITYGETSLCYLTFTAKEAVTGTGYIAAAPESTLTNQEGTFLFSECTGLLLDVCLPDFNADGITDLRDFTLLAKQYGKDGESAGEFYDIAGNDSIDDTDLDYLKKFLFAGITGAEDVETGRMADRTLQAVYTVESEQQTRVTTYEYNAADQLTKVTDCNGNSVYYDYDSCGRLVKVTDQAGYASEILYDTAGNPVQVVLPEGVTETYTYDTEGNLLTVTDSLGAATSYTYDTYGRAVSVTDAVGVTYQYQYDIAGNLVKNLFTGEEYCYNAYDEVVSFTDAEGNVTTVQYDAQGNVTDTTDALGNVTSYTYRKDGLLTKITDASGAVTLYEYNGKGLLAKETDALGAVTSYEYDRENRPVKVTAPDGTVTEYSYNTDGSITKITATKLVGDNSAVEEKEELRYLYALDGSLTASISSTDILAYTYDIRGYVESVTKNNSHTVSLAYDGNGNLTLLKESKAGTYTTDSITSYSYDTRGYLSEVRTGGTLTYHTAGYNQEGIPFLTETSEGGDILASYISRPDGLLEQMTDGAGTVTKYQYNQQRQVTGLTVTAADGTVQYRETNTYDRNGSLLTQTIGGAGYSTENLSYTYDELDRLLSETKNGKTTSYTYDSMGNRLTKTADGMTTSYVYDLCNKLLSETADGAVTEYRYDALGNLTAKTEAGETTTYAYDALNQLTEVVNPDGTWQKNTYDASGIRSMITENGITTEFMTFNGLVVSGYSKSGEQTEHYFYGSGLVAAEYSANYMAGNTARSNVAATNTAGEDTEDAETSLYYYLKNSHGDVIGLTNNTGTLTETYRYDAFGTLTKIQSLNENGVLTETDTAFSCFLYAGEQYDKVTGLYYLRARQYDTLTGRFTQEDTYLGDGRNLYVYVSNNPLKYVDPSGHDREGLVGKIQRQYVEINVVADFVTDITTGIVEVADGLWNGVKSAALGIFEGLTETPVSVATKTTLKPYATKYIINDMYWFI